MAGIAVDRDLLRWNRADRLPRGLCRHLWDRDHVCSGVCKVPYPICIDEHPGGCDLRQFLPGRHYHASGRTLRDLHVTVLVAEVANTFRVWHGVTAAHRLERLSCGLGRWRGGKGFFCFVAGDHAWLPSLGISHRGCTAD